MTDLLMCWQDRRAGVARKLSHLFGGLNHLADQVSRICRAPKPNDYLRHQAPPRLGRSASQRRQYEDRHHLESLENFWCACPPQSTSTSKYTLGIDSGDAKSGDNYGPDYHFQSIANYHIPNNIVRSSDGNRDLDIRRPKGLNGSTRLKLTAERIGSRKDFSRFAAESPAGTELRELVYTALLTFRVGIQSAIRARPTCLWTLFA